MAMEGLYNKVPVSEIKFSCELPLTTISADRAYMLLSQKVETSNYPKAYVQKGGGRNAADLITISLRR